MRERVSRRDDERLYQPAIHSRHIRRLHQISEVTGEFMTSLVDQAIGEFIQRYNLSSERETSERPTSDH